MPFLRFTRDKRGVESFALVHTTTNRRGKVRPRVLYWFRTPPDIKVGREPFDLAVRRALEAQYPDITFDWRAIAETPIPSADADKWRERRRAERALKHAAAAEASAEAGNSDEVETDEIAAAPEAEATASDVPEAASAVLPLPQGAARVDDPNRKRRRRRRSGGSRGGNPSGGTASSPPSGSEPSGG